MLNKVTNFAFRTGVVSSKGWIGPAVAAGILPLHVGMAVDRSAMIKAIGLVGVLGFLADSVLGLAGFLKFQGSDFVGQPLVPLWLLGLWLVFATTLGSSLSWLSSRPRRYLRTGEYYAGFN